jgi:hypothetical protein
MLPQSQARKKRNSSKVNLMISFALHALIVLVALYFAARQGLLGKQLKKISIEMVKEKLPEKPKEPEKPKTEEPPKAEPSRVETAKVAEAPKVTPSPVVAPPSVAPPSAEMPSFEFEGGKAVETSSDPVHSIPELHGIHAAVEVAAAGQHRRRQLCRRSGSVGGSGRSDQQTGMEERVGGQTVGRFGEAGFQRGEQYGPAAADKLPGTHIGPV